ncbi:MAG: hypothetical protein J6031_00270 [Bacteroidales bacterium]|nr:hypothetical protein [Bacteroidales bacterium]
MKTKKPLTDNDVINVINHLEIQAQKRRGLDARQHEIYTLLLQDLDKQCATARQQNAIRSSAAHLTVRTLSLVVAFFALTVSLQFDPRCNFVVNGQPLNRSYNIDRIDNLF